MYSVFLALGAVGAAFKYDIFIARKSFINKIHIKLAIRSK